MRDLKIYPDDPAFVMGAQPGVQRAYGLSKREYFASEAIKNLVVKDNYSDGDKERGSPAADATRAAITAIRYADALIEQLNLTRVK